MGAGLLSTEYEDISTQVHNSSTTYLRHCHLIGMFNTRKLDTSTVAFHRRFVSTSTVTILSSYVPTVIEQSSVGVTVICGEDTVFYTKTDYNITFYCILVAPLSD